MRTFIAGLVVGISVVPAIALIAALIGVLPVRATATPPAWERRLAGKALRKSLERKARHLTNPVPASDENLLAGMKLFRGGCAGCHGEFGHPSLWGTTSFYPRVPQFSDEPSALTAPEMFLVVKHGVRYSGMGAWGGLLSDPEIWRVVGFVSRIRTLPPAVDAAWKSRPRG